MSPHHPGAKPFVKIIISQSHRTKRKNIQVFKGGGAGEKRGEALALGIGNNH